MSYGISTEIHEDIDFDVEIKDQFDNEIDYADVDCYDHLIKISIHIPQVKDALFNTLLERHPEMRQELELLANEIQLKEGAQ